MKLSKEKFSKKNVCIKKQKQDKIPIECKECNNLSSFINNISTYYYCSKNNPDLSL